MTTVQLVILLVGLCLTNVQSSKSRSHSRSTICPTWFIESERGCECGYTSKFITCQVNTNSTSIASGYCMTYNTTSKYESFGDCPYNTNDDYYTFYPVTSNVLELDEQMCGPLNRTGLLCSQCQPGLGPAVFSWYRQCINCIRQPFGWILFVARATLPLTLFCVIVIIFQINIASPALNGFVLMAQLISALFNNDPFSVSGHKQELSGTMVFMTGYGFWNLDLFNYIIPSFCIKEGMSMLTVLALEYTVALYPIIFTIVVYCCITLHDSGCKILVCCWKPFHRCFARFRSSWKLKGSVINAFATFLLLSFSKLCSISLYLCQTTPVWNKWGVPRYHVYYDATLTSRSNEHIPYLVLSSIIALFIVCLPALFILLYQNRFFQKCLSCCKIKCVLIHELANTTQGCFKNGTTPGTRDYRWFAGLYLLLRIVLVSYVNQPHHRLMYIVLPCVMVFLTATLRPYRADRYNILDSFFWLNFSIAMTWQVYSNEFTGTWRTLHHTLLSVPLLYIICYISWKVIVQLYQLLIAKRKKKIPIVPEENNAQENDDEQLPDRPNECTPLIPTV